MNDTTKEIVNLLTDLGISEQESKILVILEGSAEIGLKQLDICANGYLYQPEVSIGLKNLIAKKWVTIINRIPAKKKGRPFGLYALCKSFDEILDEIEEGVTGEYELVMANIEKAKRIAPETFI